MIVTGWALDESGPVDSLIVLVDGRPTPARVGSRREDVAASYPGVLGADRAGWDAIVDVRGIARPTASVSALARRRGGGWFEIASSEIRLAELGPRPDARCAVFTIARNEPAFLPVWLRYYGAHFDASDVYVLDNDSTDRSADGLEGSCNLLTVHRDESAEGGASVLVWLEGVVESFFSFLLRSYDAVLFTDVDEFIVPDPERYAGGLREYVESFPGPAATCSGYNVVHQPDEGEGPLRFDEPILRQRGFWHHSPHWYSKRVLGRIPLSWNIGFHDEYNAPEVEPDPELFLLHMHRVDYDYCQARHAASAEREWPEDDVRLNLSWHQRIAEPGEFRKWFYGGEDLEGTARESIPERLRDAL